MPVLLANTMIRKDPPFGPLVSLLAGETCPDWAVGRIGQHLLGGKHSISTGKVESVVETERKEDRIEADKVEFVVETERKEDRIEIPSLRGSKLKWASFAEELGVPFAENATRDDIIAAVFEAHPELKEEE